MKNYKIICFLAMLVCFSANASAEYLEDVTGIDESYAEVEAGFWYAKWFPAIGSYNSGDPSAPDPDVKNPVNMAILPDIATNIVVGGRTNIFMQYISDKIYRAWGDELGIEDFERKKNVASLFTGALQQMLLTDYDGSGIGIVAQYTSGRFTGTLETPGDSDFGYTGTETKPDIEHGWDSKLVITDVAIGWRQVDSEWSDDSWTRAFYGAGIKVVRFSEPMVVGVKKSGSSQAGYFLTDIDIKSVLFGLHLEQEMSLTDTASLDARVFYGMGKSDIESPVFSAEAFVFNLDGMIRVKGALADYDDYKIRVWGGCRLMVNGIILSSGDVPVKASQTLYDHKGGQKPYGLASGEKVSPDLAPLDLFVGPVFGVSIVF